MVQAAGNPDLEPPRSAVHYFQRVPPGRASLTDEKLLVTQILEGPPLVDCLVRDIPLHHATGGWAIGDEGEPESDTQGEVASLYDKLERVIVPLFYG